MYESEGRFNKHQFNLRVYLNESSAIGVVKDVNSDNQDRNVGGKG